MYNHNSIQINQIKMFAVNQNNTVSELRRSPRLNPKVEDKNIHVEYIGEETFIGSKTPEKKEVVVTPSAPLKKRYHNEYDIQPKKIDLKTKNLREEENLLKSIKIHMFKKYEGLPIIKIKINDWVTEKYVHYSVYDLTKVFEIFNDNMEVLKRLNKPYDPTEPLSHKPFRYDALVRELYRYSECLIKGMQRENIPSNLKLTAAMNLTREAYFEFRHIRFDE